MTTRHTLERHRYFPIIAWALVIGFAYFVFTLTIELRATAHDLAAEQATLHTYTTHNPTDVPLRN